MDLVEFNKLTQNRKVRAAESNLYNSAKLEKYNAVVLIANVRRILTIVSTTCFPANTVCNIKSSPLYKFNC